LRDSNAHAHEQGKSLNQSYKGREMKYSTMVVLALTVLFGTGCQHDPAANRDTLTSRDGKSLYERYCNACHKKANSKAVGSVKFGDKSSWESSREKGIDALMATVIKGSNNMPPRAGIPSLTDAEIRSTVEYMLSQAQ